MRRDLLAVLGIQLPVLPTIVLGGLPGTSDWGRRLERIGLDVVASGANPDTPETFAAAASAVPHRPCKAIGDVSGAVLVEAGRAGDGYVLHPDEVVAVGPDLAPDANQLAAYILDRIRDDPSAWWVGASGLASASVSDAEEFLAHVVEAVRHVRLFLAKQQFD